MKTAFVAICLVLVGGPAAGNAAPAAKPQRPPTLRHVNYVAIRAARGRRVECRAACIAHGRSYADRLRCRLVRPDGFVAASASVRPGEKAVLAAPMDRDGLCTLETSSGWNLAEVELPAGVPHAYRSGLDAPLKTVREWGPLHFHVPAGTRYFNIFVHARTTREGLHLTVRGPRGEVVREEDGDFDSRTKVQVRVPNGRDGAAWSVAVSRAKTKGLYLDDVHLELGRHLPPFLAPRAEWARLFAGNWRYDPKAPSPPASFEKTAARLEPFRGATGAKIDRARSRDPSGGWRTSLPFTYVLDYGAKHLGSAEYVSAVATAPPALLHLGKDVPFNHGWGPIRALGGENQAYGTDGHIARISPEAVRQRIKGLKQMVDRLHEAGVRWVVPYVCGMTVNGDHERRTGFWEFYDHWDEYRRLGLAARPKDDPRDWLQRHPDGSRRIYYRYDYRGGFYPPFKTNHRYAACWRSGGWRTWLCEVVRFVARCGYDGAFVDNANSQRCQCPRCLEAFRQHLKDNFPAARARELFGDVPLETVGFPPEQNTPLYAEMNRFWCDTVRDELATLKAVGTRELGREFLVFPNGGRPECIQRGLRDADFVMFEKSTGDYGTHPGMVLAPVFEGVKLRACNDNVFEHKFVQCLRRRVRPIVLSRAGWPRRRPWLMLNASAARLGMAECGAFSGGGGFLLRPYFDVYHDALNEYRRFFEAHPDIYAGLDSYARIAVLACPEQRWLGNAAHLAAVRALTKALTEAHVLFDYVSESRLDEAALRRYEAVLAPELHAVSDAQLRTLRRYVEGGGRLIVVGGFATRGEALGERKPQPWRPAKVTHCEGMEAAVRALGRGASVLSCPDERLAPYVKVNAFRGPGRIVLHVVNYNVPLGARAPRPAAVDGIELNVPLPEGTRAASAGTHAPDEPKPTSPSVRNDAGRARLRIGTLGIYRVVELRLLRS